MAELETLMDEYYEAVGMDARRSSDLISRIIETAERAGIAADCGIEAADADDEKLLKLDNFLYDLKEMQIRDGLHIYGRPEAGWDDLITAILRIPRGMVTDPVSRSCAVLPAICNSKVLIRSKPIMLPVAGPRPRFLPASMRGPGGIRVIRSKDWGCLPRLVSGELAPAEWTETTAILDQALPQIARAIADSGTDERASAGLDGGYIPAAPAGAPTRRPEVLPTGRNFFSIDSRAVPTEAAWRIGLPRPRC